MVPLVAPSPGPARFASAEQATASAQAFDLRQITPDFIANPYPTYNALREHNPVARMPDGSYFVSRYADCIAVYKDAKLFSSDKRAEFRPKFGDGLLYEHHTTSLIFNDPPLHTRVRKIIAGALNARAVADMEAPMIALTNTLLDRIAAQGRGGPDRRPGCCGAHRGDRQSAGNTARGAFTAAGLVARDPGRARAGTRPRASGRGRNGGG